MGVIVRGGCIAFDPVLLRTQEFLSEPSDLHYVDVEGEERSIPIAAGQLGFTLCQVPVAIQVGAEKSITVTLKNGSDSVLLSDHLPEEISNAIFMKRGEVVGLTVTVVDVLH